MPRLPRHIERQIGIAPRINGAKDVYSEANIIVPFDPKTGKPMFIYDTARYGKYTPTKEWGMDQITKEHSKWVNRIHIGDHELGHTYTISFRAKERDSIRHFLQRAFRHIVYEILGDSLFSISWRYYKYLFVNADEELFMTHYSGSIRAYWIGDIEYSVSINRRLEMEVIPITSRDKDVIHQLVEASIQRDNEENKRVLESIRSAEKMDAVRKDLEQTKNVSSKTADLVIDCMEEKDAKEKEQPKPEPVPIKYPRGYAPLTDDELEAMSISNLDKRIERFIVKIDQLKIKYAELSSMKLRELIIALNDELKRINKVRNNKFAAVQRAKMEADRNKAAIMAESEEKKRQREQRAEERRIKNSTDPFYNKSKVHRYLREGGEYADIIKLIQYKDLPVGDRKTINHILPGDYLKILDNKKMLPDYDDSMEFLDENGNPMGDYEFAKYYDLDASAFVFHVNASAFDRMAIFVMAIALGQVDEKSQWIPVFASNVVYAFNEVRYGTEMVKEISFNTGERIHIERDRVGEGAIYTWKIKFTKEPNKLHKNMYGDDLDDILLLTRG